MEIERKFLLASLPPPERRGKGELIRQGYISVGDPEMRVRSKGDRFFLTVKHGEGIVRKEMEIEIGEDIFAKLWPLTDGSRIEKTRYAIEHNGLTWEIDEYHGRLTGLLTAEVELRDVNQEFDLPCFLNVISEVTEDSRYKNKSLATRGGPTSTNQPKENAKR